MKHRWMMGLCAAAIVGTASSNARAGSDDGYVVVALVAAFDVMSLPADIYMAAKGEKVPKGWAMAEAVGGGVQAGAGAIGLTFCGSDPKCRKDVGFPLLIGFTAWTTAMMVHGLWGLQSGNHTTAFDRPKSSPFTVVPMVGDGRSTPAGIGFVGSF